MQIDKFEDINLRESIDIIVTTVIMYIYSMTTPGRFPMTGWGFPL